MANTSVYIRDVQLLDQLDSSIRCSGEAMASIDINVISCFNDVKESLERQLHYIRMRLRETEVGSSAEKTWMLRYKKAKHIVEECQREITSYHATGHQLILNMNEYQIPKASQQLCEIKGRLQDILDSEVVAGV